MIFYTEILDKYYALTCTRRTLSLIEEAQGFDNYILKVNFTIRSWDLGFLKNKKFTHFVLIKTHEVDLKSDIGMQLKREMLIALAKKETDLFPNDKEKQQLVFNRYKQFLIPVNNI
jgi:large subunit ribosomal protein L28